MKLKCKLHRKWIDSQSVKCQATKEMYFKVRNKVKSAVRNAKESMKRTLQMMQK